MQEQLKPIFVNLNLSRENANQINFQMEVNLSIPSQGVTAIFGPSGSGKTTLLRCIAGLESIKKGQIRFRNQDWQTNDFLKPTHQRQIGYVFQEASLFPHFSVQQNLEYAIKRAATKPSDTFYRETIQALGIEPLLRQSPDQLSGGERQRVALARTLLSQPKLLLLDEPLASLDQESKDRILSFLESIKQQFNIPILYVTHSINEVIRLADHLVVLNQGKVTAQGHLKDVLADTKHHIGLDKETSSVIEATIAEQDEQYQLTKVVFDNEELWLTQIDKPLGELVRVRILAKDISITLSNSHDSSIVNRLKGTIEEIVTDTKSAQTFIKIQLGNEQLVAQITQRSLSQLNLSVGMDIWAQIKSVALIS